MVKVNQLQHKAVTLHLQKQIGTPHDQRIKVGLKGGSGYRRKRSLIGRGIRRNRGKWRARKANLAKIGATNTTGPIIEVSHARRMGHPTIETAISSPFTIFPKLSTNSLLYLDSGNRGAGCIERGREKRVGPGGRR